MKYKQYKQYYSYPTMSWQRIYLALPPYKANPVNNWLLGPSTESYGSAPCVLWDCERFYETMDQGPR